MSAYEGQRPDFGAFTERVRPGLVRFLAKRLGPDDAEEAVQDALVKAWRYWDRYDHNLAAEFTWAVRIALTTATDRARFAGRKKRGGALPEGVLSLDDVALGGAGAGVGVGAVLFSPEDEEPERVALRNETRDEVRTVLALLRPNQAAALLWAAQGVTNEAAARRLGVPLGTLKTRIRQGRLHFARLWTERHVVVGAQMGTGVQGMVAQ